LAFLLAGVFLVKISIDKGWLGPMARVGMAYLGGAVLLAAGEWLRGRHFTAARGAHAGGIAVLFAATMAAANLYHFISALAAMVLILVITLAGILLSLRSGLPVAVIGLIGGFSLPIFLRTDHPRVWSLLMYLLVIHLGTALVSAKKKWPGLLAGSSAALLIWGFIYARNYFSEAPWSLGALILGAVLSLVVFRRFVLKEETAPHDILTALAFVGFFLVLAVTGGPFNLHVWTMFFILSLGIILLSAREPFHWSAAGGLFILLVTEGAQFIRDEPPEKALLILTATGLLWTLGMWAVHWRSQRPASNLATGTLAALGTMGLTYLLGKQTDLPAHVGIISLGWALLLILVAVPLLKNRALHESNERLAALLAGATLLISAAIPMELEDAWLSVFWALEIPCLVFLEGRLKVPILRYLSYGLAAAVGIRLLPNPYILKYPLGAGLLFNWILYAYGLSALMFFLSGLQLRKRKEEEPSQFFFWGARIFLAALIVLQIRHYFQRGSLVGNMDNIWEMATYGLAFFLLAALFDAVRRKWDSKDDLLAARIAGVMALVPLVFFCVLGLNPMWHGAWMGTMPIFNGLLYIYLLPLLGCLFISRRVYKGLSGGRFFYQACAYVLAALLMILEVRHLYHPGAMNMGDASGMEQNTYSAVGVLLGLATLAGGIVKRSQPLRWTSLGVMVLTVGKVFLYDVRTLPDIYRVLSLAALGVFLLVIAVVYQKFVFKEK
jgi:uncharacterized membrane protein